MSHLGQKSSARVNVVRFCPTAIAGPRLHAEVMLQTLFSVLSLNWALLLLQSLQYELVFLRAGKRNPSNFSDASSPEVQSDGALVPTRKGWRRRLIS